MSDKEILIMPIRHACADEVRKEHKKKIKNDTVARLASVIHEVCDPLNAYDPCAKHNGPLSFSQES